MMSLQSSITIQLHQMHCEEHAKGKSAVCMEPSSRIKPMGQKTINIKRMVVWFRLWYLQSQQINRNQMETNPNSWKSREIDESQMKSEETIRHREDLDGSAYKSIEFNVHPMKAMDIPEYELTSKGINCNQQKSTYIEQTS